MNTIKNFIKSENRTNILSAVALITAIIAVIACSAPIAIYFAMGKEVLWLANAGVVLGGVAVVAFVAFIISVIADFCRKDEDEVENDVIDAEYTVIQ